MAYKVKGIAGPVIQSQRFTYDPEDATYYLETTYAGSAKAIQGQSSEFRVKNRSHYSTVEDNGMGQTVLRTPIASKPEQLELTVRYEISTEFIEQDIFRHKTISDAADAHDSGLGEDAATFRKIAEDGADAHSLSIASGSTLERVVKHLRKGITGFEREYIVLKRSRKVAYFGTGPVPQAAILDGRFIYTTAQLGLPDAIAFGLPDLTDLPVSDWDDVEWGWRRRPSSVVYEGNFIEQSSEFILAEWSLMLYTPATEPATW